jgi:hypothetical protein
VRLVFHKPLFIPLKGEFYDAFERGDKEHEYRVAGPRWNADTCWVGRTVTLSRGYGKSRRLCGEIVSFSVSHTPCKTAMWREIYGDRGPAAIIGIKVLPQGESRE